MWSSIQTYWDCKTSTNKKVRICAEKSCLVVTMKIAVEGCCHGELDKIYQVLLQAQDREGVKIDLLICCGDFQAVRNDEDLACMAVPQKYKHMQSFYKYYSGEKVAPILTVFIGGNHEASNHLWELSYGGWVAPNIYYLGNAGVVNFGGLRIAGLSGIYKGRDYRKNRFESPPFDNTTMRTAYHVRSCDVFRLKQLSGDIDIMLSHDWPLGIYHHGNKEQLLRIKPFFREEISNETLGSPPAMELLKHLKPSYWFSAHLHVKFAAVYSHQDDRHTKFLALDKCLPRRKFLQIIDIQPPTKHEVMVPNQLRYDPEWLAILRSTEPLMKYTSSLWLPPHPLTDERCSFTPTSGELEEVHRLFGGDLCVPDNFVQTVTPYDPTKRINFRPVVCARENPQTTDLCRKLHLPNYFAPCTTTPNLPQLASNPDEITLDDSDDDIENMSHHMTSTSDHMTGSADHMTPNNPDEIPLDVSDEEEPSMSHGVTSEGLEWSIEADTRSGQHTSQTPQTNISSPQTTCTDNCKPCDSNNSETS